MVEVVPPEVEVGTYLEVVITYLVNLEEEGSSQVILEVDRYQVVGVDNRAILVADKYQVVEVNNRAILVVDKYLEEDSSRAVLGEAIGQLKL